MGLIATIRKNADAEIRISRQEFKGLQVVDIRVWFEPKDGGERVPSRKGVTFDEKLLPDVIAGLNAAAGAAVASTTRRSKA